MISSADLQTQLSLIAERTRQIKAACTNEESTKLYLVLPVLRALEYDYSDPYEVQAEYAADFRDDPGNKVDYVILRDGEPIVAIECKKVGANLEGNRGQLRSYFTALRSVKLGLLTDGIRFEFFVDCDNPNVMDEEPFLTLDMDVVLQGPLQLDVLDALTALSKSRFDPDDITAMAEMRLVAKRLRSALVDEVREPSEEFCRMMLQRIGIKNLRKSSIETRYSALIRAAYEEAIVRPVVDQLRAVTNRSTLVAHEEAADRQIVTTDRELAVYRYVCRRLAFLASDERQFSAIEQVRYRDYLGKFVIYFENVRKGRLFDFIEGGNGYDKFVFPEPVGEIVTNAITDIDEPLRTIFVLRLREVGPSQLPRRELARA